MKGTSEAGRPFDMLHPRDVHNLILNTSRPIVLPLNPWDHQGTNCAPNIKAASPTSSRVAGQAAQWQRLLFAPPSSPRRSSYIKELPLVFSGGGNNVFTVRCECGTYGL